MDKPIARALHPLVVSGCRLALIGTFVVGMALTASPAPSGAVTSTASKAAALSVGFEKSCLVTVLGTVKCWDNGGQAMDVPGLGSGAIAVSVGVQFACAVTTAGGVKCWGVNAFGELGDGTFTTRSVPVDVIGLGSGVIAVATGDRHACALKATGSVACWGDNEFGELGDGTTVTSPLPVAVRGLTGASSIAAGNFHNCAVVTTGALECWGFNGYGQLGDGTTEYRFTPVAVVGLGAGATAAALGEGDTCVLTTLGGVKCWGNNELGALGIGTLSGVELTPRDVVGLSSGVVAIAAGNHHGCALTAAGALECWGWNGYGQLGDGTFFSRGTPMNVTGLTSSVVAVDASFTTTCALVDSGAVKCWGENWGVTAVDVLFAGPPSVVPGVASPVVEGDVGTTTLNVPVSLSYPSAQTVTAQYNTLLVPGDRPDQATPGVDYIPTSGTVTYAPGETTKTVPITIIGDTLVEPDEYVMVTFHDPTNATIGGYWGLGIGFITNDD